MRTALRKENLVSRQLVAQKKQGKESTAVKGPSKEALLFMVITRAEEPRWRNSMEVFFVSLVPEMQPDQP